MSDQMKVLVVDDAPRARQSIKALLATLPQVQAMCEATNGREAIELVSEWMPDAVVMDIQMAEMDGLEATEVIKNRWPSVKVIVLSMYGDYEAQALTVGADAFVNKGEPPGRLLAALEAVAHYRC